MKIYEGLFLVNSSEARKDFDAVCQRVEGIITKYSGEIQRNERWGERKLAYPVKKRDRGAYILVYFHAPPESIVQIKHDCVIDEVIMRNMILRINAIPELKVKPEEVKVPEEKSAKKEGQPEEQTAQAVEQDAVGTAQVPRSEEEDGAAAPETPAEEEPVVVVEVEPVEEPADKQAGQAVEQDAVETEQIPRNEEEDSAAASGTPAEEESKSGEQAEEEPVAVAEAEPVEEPADKQADQAGEVT